MLDLAQKEHGQEIEDLMKEAEDEAADILSETSDESEAAEEIEKVMQEVAEEINEINAEHDTVIIGLSKTKLVTEMVNDAIKGEAI